MDLIPLDADEFFAKLNRMETIDETIDIITFNMTLFETEHPVLEFLDHVYECKEHRIIVSVPLLRECKIECEDCRRKYNERIDKLNKYAKIWNIRFIQESHLKYYRVGNRVFTGGVNLSPSTWLDTMIEVNKEEIKEVLNRTFNNVWTTAEKIAEKVEMTTTAPPTTKQLTFIKSIEEVVGVKYEGTTIKHASDYIGEHIADFYNKK